MTKELRERCLTEMGYRYLKNLEGWAKPVGYTLLVWTEFDMALCQIFTNPQGKQTLWTQKKFEYGGDVCYVCSFKFHITDFENNVMKTQFDTVCEAHYGFLTQEQELNLIL